MRQYSARLRITGLDDGWAVNMAGVVYRHRKVQPITSEVAKLADGRTVVLQTVDLGPKYAGPVPSPGCDADCGVCRFEDHPDAWRGPEPKTHLRSTLRLVDEIVCFAFRGAPPHGWRASRPHHIDGDDQNCGAENLAWVADKEFLEWRGFKHHNGLLRPDHLPIRVVGYAAGHFARRPLFTESASVPGHTPTLPQQIGA